MNESSLDAARARVMEMGNGYMPACLLSAAAELDVWAALGRQRLSAEQLAQAIKADPRGVRILLDGLAALGLLEKHDHLYAVPEPLQTLLVAESPESVLPMVLHRANAMRCWAQLAWTVKAGLPFPRTASIRGVEADRAAFIGAMHVVSGPVAESLVARLGPLRFEHLLDVGGASGTWTLAFLRAVPEARATIFDLPHAIVQAGERIAQSGMAERIRLVPGDFYRDELPGGADFAWVSAIAHQHSREHNRALFAKVFAALGPGGRIAVRDVVMEPCRTRPVGGALFAVNMLANTATGGTFTFEEFADDLRAAGFVDPVLRTRDEWMDSVVEARKPEGV